MLMLKEIFGMNCAFGDKGLFIPRNYVNKMKRRGRGGKEGLSMSKDYSMISSVFM